MFGFSTEVFLTKPHYRATYSFSPEVILTNLLQISVRLLIWNLLTNLGAELWFLTWSSPEKSWCRAMYCFSPAGFMTNPAAALCVVSYLKFSWQALLHRNVWFLTWHSPPNKPCCIATYLWFLIWVLLTNHTAELCMVSHLKVSWRTLAQNSVWFLTWISPDKPCCKAKHVFSPEVLLKNPAGELCMVPQLNFS